MLAEDQLRGAQELGRVLHRDRERADRWITVPKFESPTQVAGSTRFVCCNDIVTRRTIGYHENAPKTASSGNRKNSVVRPPPRTHVERRPPGAGSRRSRPLLDSR